ncbi:MAG TPA: YceI family protein [Saprospiraceae bacterium]|nr:YceI family protein [Saprospiraceae bacterium]HND87561.1 YceI family protein [Saprospiraceae bacterium]HNG89608.1 YceI family protein [Saprospiraceae bacterium]
MRYSLAIALLLTVFHVFGQSNYRVSGYNMVIKGTSNLHDWESSVKEVRANGTLLTDASGLNAIQSLYVEVPVRSIKSSKGSIMDGKTYDALRSGDHPNITYKLERVSGINKKSGGFDLNASGYLTIAGTTNKIDLYVQGRIGGDGGITFSGSKKLKMTDYKVKPPTALLGTLTTGDDVEIVFQVTLKQG